MTNPYQPITKEHAATILSVSKRTIDNWIAEGVLPKPVAIGRRVYWHPSTFVAWLDQQFRVPTEHSVPSVEPARTRGRPRATFTLAQ